MDPSKEQEEVDVGSAKGAENGPVVSDRADAAPTTAMNADVLSVLVRFVPEDQFLFFAPVSRIWREAWPSQHPTVTGATSSPYLSVSQLEESLEAGLPRDRVELCTALARRGNLELLQLARERGCAWGAATCAAAARGGYLEVLQWCKYNGCPWSEDTLSFASRGGFLEVVQWARGFGCNFGRVTSAEASRAGHLDIVRFLKENGCPFDELACQVAARSGHLSVLKYLRENNCPWDGMTVWGAAKAGQLLTLDWALENGAPFDGLNGFGKLAFLAAVEGGHLPIIECLHRNGCSWHKESCLAMAVSKDHGHIVTWLRDN